MSRALTEAVRAEGRRFVPILVVPFAIRYVLPDPKPSKRARMLPGDAEVASPRASLRVRLRPCALGAPTVPLTARRVRGRVRAPQQRGLPGGGRTFGEQRRVVPRSRRYSTVSSSAVTSRELLYYVGLEIPVCTVGSTNVRSSARGKRP